MPNFLTSESKNRTETHNPQSTEMMLCSHCGRESQIQARVELVDLREKYEKLLKVKKEVHESFPNSNLFRFEPESSIGSEDFESFPNEAELALESSKFKRDSEKSQVDEELGSPASQSSTKSCVVLKSESEEEEDVSVETIAIPEYGLSRACSDDIDESQSEAAPAGVSHSTELVHLPASIPETRPTGIKSPGEVASTTDEIISPSREDPKKSESSPPVLPHVSIAKVGPTELVPVESAMACLEVPYHDRSMPEPDPEELLEPEPDSFPSVPMLLRLPVVLMADVGVKKVFKATEAVSAEQVNHNTFENAPETEINTACSGLLPIEADHALEVKDHVSSQETPSAKDISTREDELLGDGDIELDHPEAIPATEDENFLDLEEDHIPSAPLSSSLPSLRIEYTKSQDPAKEGNVLQEEDIKLRKPVTNPGIEDKKLLDLEENETPSSQLLSFLPPSTENSTRSIRPSADNGVLVKRDGERRHPEITSVVEKAHVRELEDDKAEASSIPLPISTLSSSQELSDSEDLKKGADVHAKDEQNKSKIDAETALFQETHNNADIKETGESESDNESPVRPSFGEQNIPFIRLFLSLMVAEKVFQISR
ncbi:hypothetical protein CROQUDRAFT_238921 [Cronartium quercuum f. sp. fusiforme G11]|uniref:Uncharacterized protein n=1 Tax=Cronartium quercuum f. sp. fusiforme G11 TaxID=708437 RepID=A0A9P6NDP3_9BASI|nr:hypothetical protein CROQUDRAFT_238921 [Cronartium quercuum f. sp. fusiforme G11]